MTNRSDRSTKIGNTNQSSPVVYWFFTLNNYRSDEIDPLIAFLNDKCVKYRFQEEIGEEGTPHLQGCIQLKKKDRMTSLKKHNDRIHWEKTRNEQAASEYVWKDETHFGRRWDKGYPRPIKIITELRPWQKMIEDISKGEPDDRTIHWIWETVGSVGKSAFTKYMVVKNGAAFCDGGSKKDLVNLIYNTDMDKCNCVIFDIPRSKKGNISYATLECLKNGLICNTKYETGFKAFNSPHVFVFANFPPSNLEDLSLDRWHIVCLDDSVVFDDVSLTLEVNA